MFCSEETDNLLFNFKRSRRYSIHSLFCPNFLAIWLKDNKVIDLKLIEDSMFFIRPKKKFNKLIEVPVNRTNLNLINFLVERWKRRKV